MSAVLKAFKAPKVTPKKAVVGKTGANSGKSTIFGGPIAPSAVIIAPEEIDTIESILPCSIIPGQSIALKMIGRISNFRPPTIVDLPEMKGLLTTSTACEKITVQLNVDVIDYFKAESVRTGIPYQNIINFYLTDCAREGKHLTFS